MQILQGKWWRSDPTHWKKHVCGEEGWWLDRRKEDKKNAQRSRRKEETLNSSSGWEVKEVWGTGSLMSKGNKHPQLTQGFWNLHSFGIKPCTWCKGAAAVAQPRAVQKVVSAGSEVPEEGCLSILSPIFNSSHMEAVIDAIHDYFSVSFAPGTCFGKLLLKILPPWRSTTSRVPEKKSSFTHLSFCPLIAFCSIACVYLTQNIWRA